MGGRLTIPPRGTVRFTWICDRPAARRRPGAAGKSRHRDTRPAGDVRLHLSAAATHSRSIRMRAGRYTASTVDFTAREAGPAAVASPRCSPSSSRLGLGAGG